jgi:hypothetical protein
VACALGAALVAAGCGGGSNGTSTTSAAAASAPACLPASVDHSAKLAGVPVDVSPTPGTGTADPHTQISFLGVPAGEVHAVSVVGTRSGHHAGRLEAYSQGDGASFVPNAPFVPGEQVDVHAVIGAGSGGTPIAFSFGVDSPKSTAGVASFGNPQAPPSDYQTFATLPGVQAPTMTVTVPDRDPSAGDIFTTNGPGPGRYGPLIYNAQGQLVWFDQLSGGLVADDLNVQTYQGQSDLTLWEGKVPSWGFGQGWDIVMNSHYQTVATIKGGNGLEADLHDFQIAPHDIAYITAYNPIRCDLASQGGQRNGVILDATVLEIDMATGLVRWEWHSLDHVAVSESETSAGGAFWDYFHLNSIDPEPDGNLLISARNTWAAYQIQAGTGTILWRLGGVKSSFKMGPGTTTYWQHDARMLPDGEVTMFDDGADPPHESQSRVVRIALAESSHAARLATALTHPDQALLAASQGNAQTLANANTVVGYGGVPYVSEYAPAGSLLFDAHFPLDQVFYRAYRHPWSGSPLTPPAAAANLNNTNEETIVHMSWNGATGVASWRVLAGSSRGALTPRTTVSATGFETSAILPATYGSGKSNGYVEVEALDSAGSVLGTSQPVAVASYNAMFASGGRSG